MDPLSPHQFQGRILSLNTSEGPSPKAAAATHYISISSPPTPAPSPGPSTTASPNFSQYDPAHLSRREFAELEPLGTTVRRQYLAALLGECTPSELLFISTTIAPLLKRDFLRELPAELALHVLSFIDDPRTLTRAGQVSRYWRRLLADEGTWKRMCDAYEFALDRSAQAASPALVPQHAPYACEGEDDPLEEMEQFAMLPMDPALEWIAARKRQERRSSGGSASSFEQPPPASYLQQFKQSYLCMMNWRHGGRLLRAHRVPVLSPESAVVTSIALDADWVVVGLANYKIHVFSARTGVLSRTLIGHELGVWAVNLVSRGGQWGGGGKGDGTAESFEHLVTAPMRSALGLDVPEYTPGIAHEKTSDVCCASEGWGQPNALVVSGGCDKVLRVWDVKSGYCIYALPGHTSTIRCVRVLHNRPVAVTGSRDATLRVWDVQRGRMLRVLRGHTSSVRCLDVCGRRVVSGSYDTTCRLWDIDTGACIHVLHGHYHQIYSVAFDGVRIASGGLDTTVRVWDAESGTCVALLQGHSALVCQLQLAPTVLATGGSDGRVITFSLATFAPVHRIAAHDSSVTALQFDSRWLVTGGNDGRVRLFEARTGRFVRELSEPCESVWRVAHRGDTCAVMCKRAGKTVMEIWSFK